MLRHGERGDSVVVLRAGVVRDEDRFLVVQERKHEQRWYLPAGRVELGER